MKVGQIVQIKSADASELAEDLHNSNYIGVIASVGHPAPWDTEVELQTGRRAFFSKEELRLLENVNWSLMHQWKRRCEIIPELQRMEKEISDIWLEIDDIAKEMKDTEGITYFELDARRNLLLSDMRGLNTEIARIDTLVEATFILAIRENIVGDISISEIEGDEGVKLGYRVNGVEYWIPKE